MHWLAFEPHSFPHRPQWSISVRTLTQVGVPPEMQQFWSAVHARPHPPQWDVLDVVSTQAPSQQLRDGPHAGWEPQRQVPPTQDSPLAHGGSHAGSTQRPPWQTFPPVHGLPQRPQC